MSLAQNQSVGVILQMLLPNLEAEGFQVFLHPSRAVLPPFMRGYQPDAIAMKANKKVAIEVVLRPNQAASHGKNLQAMFQGHPDWELRMVYAPPGHAAQEIAVKPKDLVVETLDRVLTIFDEAGPVPALLTGWSVFEAAARTLLPANLARPQPAARLLEVLASDGYLTPDEADAVRRLGRMRDEAAHGGLDIVLTRDDLDKLVSATRVLLAATTPGE